MKMTTTAFNPEASIPKEYTCDGVNISPPLTWKNVPEKAKSLVLIMDDPDAPSGTWTHWIMYNIPVTGHGLTEHRPAEQHLADGSLQGKNSFPNTGYGGPCPPPGHGSHRYYFRLYALDMMLSLDPTTTGVAALKGAIKGHILATAELMGRYERQK